MVNRTRGHRIVFYRSVPLDGAEPAERDRRIDKLLRGQPETVTRLTCSCNVTWNFWNIKRARGGTDLGAIAADPLVVVASGMPTYASYATVSGAIISHSSSVTFEIDYFREKIYWHGYVSQFVEQNVQG